MGKVLIGTKSNLNASSLHRRCQSDAKRLILVQIGRIRDSAVRADEFLLLKRRDQGRDRTKYGAGQGRQSRCSTLRVTKSAQRKRDRDNLAPVPFPVRKTLVPPPAERRHVIIECAERPKTELFWTVCQVINHAGWLMEEE